MGGLTGELAVTGDLLLVEVVMPRRPGSRPSATLRVDREF